MMRVMIPLLAGATVQGVCLLEFVDSGRVEPQLRRLAGGLGAASAPGESPFFSALRAQLDEYFTGNEAYNPPKEVLDRCTVFHDLGDFVSVYNEAWNAIKMK